MSLVAQASPSTPYLRTDSVSFIHPGIYVASLHDTITIYTSTRSQFAVYRRCTRLDVTSQVIPKSRNVFPADEVSIPAFRVNSLTANYTAIVPRPSNTKHTCKLFSMKRLLILSRVRRGRAFGERPVYL